MSREAIPSSRIPRARRPRPARLIPYHPRRTTSVPTLRLRPMLGRRKKTLAAEVEALREEVASFDEPLNKRDGRRRFRGRRGCRDDRGGRCADR